MSPEVGEFASGLAAPATVRTLRQGGPRLVMAGGSGLGAAGMLAWAVSPSVPTLYLAWIVIGVAMAATLYEPAMVVLVDLDPSRRRWTLSVLTAAGGLASTVFAPLTAALTDALGWRAAIAVLATAVSALTGIVHLCCLPGRSARPPDLAAGADHQAPLTRDLRRLRTAVLVEQTAYVATSAQLVGFLTPRAVPLHTASAVLGTMGPRPGRIRSRRQPLRSDHQRLVATTAERRIRGIRMFRRQGSSVRRVAHVQSRSRSTAWLTWE